MLCLKRLYNPNCPQCHNIPLPPTLSSASFSNTSCSTGPRCFAPHTHSTGPRINAHSRPRHPTSYKCLSTLYTMGPGHKNEYNDNMYNDHDHNDYYYTGGVGGEVRCMCHRNFISSLNRAYNLSIRNYQCKSTRIRDNQLVYRLQIGSF